MNNARLKQVVGKCKLLGDGTCPCGRGCYIANNIDRWVGEAVRERDQEKINFLEEKRLKLLGG